MMRSGGRQSLNHADNTASDGFLHSDKHPLSDRLVGFTLDDLPQLCETRDATLNEVTRLMSGPGLGDQRQPPG